MANILIEQDTMQSIADSIRTKNGTSTTYLPSEMPAAIEAISGSSGGDLEEALINAYANVTYGQYLFAGEAWTDVLNALPSMPLNVASSVGLAYGFHGNTALTKLPFTSISVANTSSSGTSSIGYCFYNCQKLTKIPAMTLTNPTTLTQCFYNCNSLEELPEMTYTQSSTSNYASHGYIFYGCYKIKEIPESWLNLINQVTRTGTDSNVSSGNFWGSYGFYNCHNLREVTDLWTPAYSTMSATYPFDYCSMMSRITFNPDLTRSYTSGTWNLNKYLGYFSSTTHATSRAGLSTDYRVTDDTSYASLKDTEDWWTTDPAYSRYNHTSAAETLASLPTVTSATIVFNGECGGSTDGGAISELTDEEIAVATDKGWTVSIQ